MHRFKVVSLSDRHAFIKLSDRVAIITQALKRPGKGGRRARLVAAYAGFNSQAAAIAFVAGLKRYFSKAYCEVRRATRLTACQWEVKIRYFNETALETFMWSYSENPAIVSSEVTPDEAKRSIYPIEPIAPVRPVQPMKVKPIELAPLQIRSNRPLRVGRVAIE